MFESFFLFLCGFLFQLKKTSLDVDRPMPSRALSSSYVSKKKNEYEVGRYLKNIVTDGAISFFIYAGFPLADIVVMTNIQFYGTKSKLVVFFD